MPKGQKTCKQCSKEVGPRTKICSCGYLFPTKNNKTKKEPKKKEQIQQVRECRGFSLIYTPGRGTDTTKPFCPVKMKSTSEEDVKAWVDKLYNMEFSYCGRKTRWAKSAILYFVQDQVPMFKKGEEYPRKEYTSVYSLVNEYTKLQPYENV